MKRIIALFLATSMLLTGCAETKEQISSFEEIKSQTSNTATESNTSFISQIDSSPKKESEVIYESFDNKQLLENVKEQIYNDTAIALDDTECLVESVNVTYISKEYLEEVAFNSQSNIFLGYTLAEVEEMFNGKKHVFTVNNTGETVVEEFKETEKTNFGNKLTNLASTFGQVLVDITISVASKAAGKAPELVKFLFKISPQTAIGSELLSTLCSSVVAGVAEGIKKQDIGVALTETVKKFATTTVNKVDIAGLVGRTKKM